MALNGTYEDLFYYQKDTNIDIQLCVKLIWLK